MTDELESQIRAAMAGSSSEGDTDDAPAPDTGGESSGGDDAPTGGTPAADATDEAESPKSERARDEKGRFAQGAKPTGKTVVTPKLAPKPASPVGGTVPNAGEAGATPTPSAAPPSQETFKAPQAWTAAEREHFAKAPPEIQRAIARRETEIARGFNEIASSRRVLESFQNLAQQHAAVIQAEGGNPLNSFNNYLQAMSVLHSGGVPQKAGLLANVIRQSGIPIEALAAALDGQPIPGSGQHPQAPHFDPEALLRQAEERAFARVQQAQRQSQMAKLQQEAEQFAAEFLDDYGDDGHMVSGGVRELMVKALRGGLASTPQEAYELACKLHGPTSKILAQREAAAQAKAGIASTQRSRAAASSVRTNPTAAPEPTAGDDLDSQIRAAMKAAGRR